MVIPARKVIANIGTLLLVYSLALAREVNLFSSFFPLVMEKDEKTCFNAEKNDFDQQTAFRAPTGRNTQQQCFLIHVSEVIFLSVSANTLYFICFGSALSMSLNLMLLSSQKLLA